MTVCARLPFARYPNTPLLVCFPAVLSRTRVRIPNPIKQTPRDKRTTNPDQPLEHQNHLSTQNEQRNRNR